MSESELSVIEPEALKTYIWLQCFDGSIQQVEEEVAMFCPMICREIVKNGTGSSKNHAIALPERVNPASLSLILDYCRFHQVPGRSNKEQKSFDEKFVRIDKEKLCELTSAADSLQLKPLVDLTSRALARIIEGKTPEEIRDIFHLPDDLTEEEKLEPLKSINDDPRIRLLNRLYAKKRKELQERQKLKDIQVQQEQKDERSLDELLCFINGDGGVVERLAAMSRKSTSTAPDFDSATPDFDSTTTTDFDCDGTCCLTDRRLETWDDPNHRESEFTLKELRQACVDAAKRQFSLKTRPPTREERLKRIDEHDRNSLMIALQAYAKKNNMQSTDLEFVEVKQRNLIDESGEGYLHFNFSVKERDGKLANFFAELHPNLENENDVYLFMPLEEKDLHPSEDNEQAHCYGCKDRAKYLVHPSGGGFLGGHKDVGFPFMDLESDDESDDDGFPFMDLSNDNSEDEITRVRGE